MGAHFRFLLVDDNPDGLYLLSKTLLRCFPGAELHHCVNASAARHALQTHHFSAAIIHRAQDFDGLKVVAAVRELDRKVPIIYLSWSDRADEAVLAGANRFLNYNAWLLIGTVVSDLLPRQVAPETGTIALAEGTGAARASENSLETERAS